MFSPDQVKYVVRCLAAGAAASVAAFTIAAADGKIDGGEALRGGLTGASTALAYAGFGAASKTVEPNVGRKAESVDEA